MANLNKKKKKISKKKIVSVVRTSEAEDIAEDSFESLTSPLLNPNYNQID